MVIPVDLCEIASTSQVRLLRVYTLEPLLDFDIARLGGIGGLRRVQNVRGTLWIFYLISNHARSQFVDLNQ